MSDLRSHLSALLARCEAVKSAASDAVDHALYPIAFRSMHGEDTGEAAEAARQCAVRLVTVHVLSGEARLAIAHARQILDGGPLPMDPHALSSNKRARALADEALAALDRADREVRQARLWAGLPIEPRAADCGGGELNFHAEA